MQYHMQLSAGPVIRQGKGIKLTSTYAFDCETLGTSASQLYPASIQPSPKRGSHDILGPRLQRMIFANMSLGSPCDPQQALLVRDRSPHSACERAGLG
jgi:hypothetical protein